MKYDSLKQLYDAIRKNIVDYKIVLNDDNLIIENSLHHVIKIIFNKGYFDVYIDDIYYYDVDKFDIEETLESIMSDYIYFKNNDVFVLTSKEFEKVIKKDANAHVFKF